MTTRGGRWPLASWVAAAVIGCGPRVQSPSDLDAGNSGDESTGDGSSSGTAADPDTDSTGAADGSVAVCGDGLVEGVEACDDGNSVDLDGCNTGCRPTGEVIWSLIEDGGMNLWDRPTAVAIDPDGQIVVGYIRDAQQSGWHTDLEALSPEGEVNWSTRYNSVGRYLVADLLIDGQGGIVVAAAEMKYGVGVISRLFPDDGALEWHSSTEIYAGLMGVATDADDRIWAAGGPVWMGGCTALAVQVDLAGNELQSPVDLPLPPAPCFIDVAAADGALYVLGDSDVDGGFVARTTIDDVPFDDLEVHTLHASTARPSSIAAAGDGIWVVGDFPGESPDESAGGFVARVQPMSAEVPEIPATETAGGALVDVAIAPNGFAVTVGTEVVDGVTELLVQSWSPDADKLWSATYGPCGSVNAVAVAADGSIVVAAQTADEEDPDAWVLRLAP